LHKATPLFLGLSKYYCDRNWLHYFTIMKINFTRDRRIQINSGFILECSKEYLQGQKKIGFS